MVACLVKTPFTGFGSLGDPYRGGSRKVAIDGRGSSCLSVGGVWCSCEDGAMTNETAYDSADFHPRVFMSYSSAEGHNEWVLRLCTRLRGNGVDVVLDQWEASLGSDLAHFMEQGLVGADRVIAVCSDSYIQKANEGQRGVGYEKKIMTAALIKNAVSDHIVPVIRDASGSKVTPVFLDGVRYADFRDDDKWDTSYNELLFDLFGQRIQPKPVLGKNPFAANSTVITAQAIQFDPTAFVSSALNGTVTFPYNDNDGNFVIGNGVNAFTVAVSTAGHGSIHFLNDPSDISSIALAASTRLEDVQSPENYDGSSRARTVRVGDSVVLVNTAGRVAAVEIVEVTIRDTAADGVPMLTLRYSIAA